MHVRSECPRTSRPFSRWCIAAALGAAIPMAACERTPANAAPQVSNAAAPAVPGGGTSVSTDTATGNAAAATQVAASAAGSPDTSASRRAGSAGSAGAASGPPTTSAPSAMRSTLSGVYSEAQALQGEALYIEACASCHHALGNHEGAVFKMSWGGVPALELLDYLTESMPKQDPGSLSRPQYLSLMAYLFKLNGMPAGPAPLPADAATLRQIRIDTVPGKAAPLRVP